MSEERKIPGWMEDAATLAPVVTHGHDSVAIVMSKADFNGLIFLLGVACAASPDAFGKEFALRLARQLCSGA